VKIDGAEIDDAGSLLRVTDRTLGVVIARAIGREPTLTVVSQSIVDPPHPAWAVPPLGAASRLLVRRTSYGVGRLALSRNLACVDLDRVPTDIAADLESERLNLGELFVSDAIEKSAFRFEVPDVVDRSLHEGYPEGLVPFDPCVSRRYDAALGGSVAFVVVESLPVSIWSDLLASQEERDRLLRLASPGAA
jgi:chorismate-pyruvate lyase